MTEPISPDYILDTRYDAILRHGPQDNVHVQELRKALEGDFHLVMKISEIDPANVQLWINNKPRLVRKNKHDRMLTFNDTIILEGTDPGHGGSIRYPAISFEEGFGVISTVTKGFPHLDLKTYKMKIEIYTLERINT